MKALRPTATSWSSLAALFEPELGGAIAAMAGRIETLLGPLREQVHTRSGEPDGFAGLARRGSYERLLLSEWLLAEEAPDEFLRRAVAHEHAFHALARREPQGARLAVVLVDVGPATLGAPRVGALAALVALDRRAARADAALRFGWLSDPTGTLRDEVNGETLQALHRARTDRTPPSDLGPFRETLRALGPIAELLVIGGSDVTRLDPGVRTTHLAITEPFTAETPKLELVLRERDRPARRVTIDLPAPDDCIRLLRDPFAERTTRRPVLLTPRRDVLPSLDGPWALSSNGARFAAILPDGRAVSCGVTGLGREVPPEPVFLSPEPGELLFAIGFDGRPLVALGAMGRTIREHRQGRRRPAWLGTVPADRPIERILDSEVLHFGHDTNVLLTSRARDVVAMGRAPSGLLDIAPFALATTGAVGTRRRTGRTYSVRLDAERRRLFARIDGSEVLLAGHGGDAPPRVFLASEPVRGSAHVLVTDTGSAALFEVGPSTTSVSRGTFALDVEALVGLLLIGGIPHAVLRENDRTLRFSPLTTAALRGFTRVFARPIRRVIVAAAAPVIAVGTDEPKIEIVHLALHRTLLTMGARRGP